MLQQYGKSLETIEYETSPTGVKAVFKDGTSVKGNLVVGADGPHSTVRELLLDPVTAKASQLGVTQYGVHACYNDAEKARFVRDNTDPIFCVAFTPQNLCLFMTIQDVPDPEKPETWVFQLMMI